MTTPKYALYNTEFSVQGWDTIMNSNSDTLDDIIHTNLLITLGETIAQYKAVGIFRGETKYKKAQANGRLQPALGITLVAGVDNDEINIQRIGPITNVGWSWAIGKPVYLDPFTAGDLTQAPSGAFTQFMGMAESATIIILNGTIEHSAFATTTTTSTTTTTNTQSTTSSTTSSTVSSTSTTTSTSTSSSTTTTS